MRLFLFFGILSATAWTDAAGFRDSFDKESGAWIPAAGWAVGVGPHKSLAATDNKGVALVLKHNLPMVGELRFFMRLPKGRGRAGFALLSSTGAAIRRFEIAGALKEEDGDEGAGPEPQGGLFAVDGAKADLLQPCAPLRDANFHEVRLRLDGPEARLDVDGQTVATFQAQARSFGLWADGKEAAEFDELELLAAETLVRDFPGDGAFSGFGEFPLWRSVPGDWTRVELPVSKGVALLAGSPGRIWIKEALPPEAVVRVELRLDEPGEAGLCLGRPSAGEETVVKLSSDLKNALQLVRQRSGAEAKLAAAKAEVAVGLWHRLEVARSGRLLTIRLDGERALEAEVDLDPLAPVGLAVLKGTLTHFRHFAVMLPGNPGTLEAVRSLKPAHVDPASGWHADPVLACEAGGRLEWREVWSQPRNVSAVLAPTESFRRLALRLGGGDFSAEFDIVRQQGKFTSIVLIRDARLPARLSMGPKDELSALYRDEGNRDMAEIQRLPLELSALKESESPLKGDKSPPKGDKSPLKGDKGDKAPLKVGLPFSAALRGVGPDQRIVFTGGGAAPYESAAIEKDAFKLEILLSGSASLSQLRFDRAGAMEGALDIGGELPYHVKEGVWRFRGGTFSDLSLELGGELRLIPALAPCAELALGLKRREKGGVVRLLLSHPARKPDALFEIDLRDAGRALVTHQPGSKEGTAQRVAQHSGNAEIRVVKSPRGLTVWAGPELVTYVASPPEAAMDRIALQLVSGDFEVTRFHLEQHPASFACFRDSSTLLRDGTVLTSDRPFELADPLKGAATGLVLAGPTRALRLKQRLPPVFALGAELDMRGLGAGASLAFNLAGSTRCALVCSAEESGTRFEWRVADAPVFSEKTAARAFSVLLSVGEKHVQLYQDGRLLKQAEFKKKPENAELTLDFKAAAGAKAYLRDFAVYDAR